jgi:hypothetical protein
VELSKAKKQFTLIVILMACIFFNTSTGFAEFISPGKLTKSHKEISGLKNCIKCHTLGEGLSDSTCKSCHEKLMDRLKQKKGFHATVNGKCIDCHTDHKGEDYDILSLDKEQFDHKKTGYDLRDSHRVSCDKCHKQKKTYLGLSTECLTCHTDVHKKTLSVDCLKCHNYEAWKKVEFEHDKYSEYTLTGRHKEAKCEGCHPEQLIKGTAGEAGKVYKVLKFKPLKSGECSDCHYEIHKDKLKDNTCRNCHSTEDWIKTTVKHNNVSDFKLEGQHQDVSCDLCHLKEKTIAGLKGKEIETQARKLTDIDHNKCNDCHFDIHKKQFQDKKCESCHSVKNKWKQITFKHESDEYKGYKLEGRHTEVDCEKCHVRSKIQFAEFNTKKKASVGKFSDLKSEKCNDCHFDVHLAKFKGNTCKNCHEVKNEWKQHIFRHEAVEYTGMETAYIQA